MGNRPIGVARHPRHLGFALEPAVLELSPGLVEEPPIKGERGMPWGDGGDIRDAPGCGGREPGAGEVESPFWSTIEETSPDCIILGIYAPCPGYRATGDDRLQVKEAEEVYRKFGGESCDDICGGGEGVEVNETGLVIDEFAFLSVQGLTIVDKPG